MKREPLGRKCIEFTREDIVNLITEKLNEEGYALDKERVDELESIKVYVSEKNDSQTYMKLYFEDIFFETKESAQGTLDCLRACILDFGHVSIYDLYSINDLPTNFRHMHYGWTNLDEAYVALRLVSVVPYKPYGSAFGYKIIFPPLERVY